MFKSVRSIPRWLRVAAILDLVGYALHLGLTAFFTYNMLQSVKLGEVGAWYVWCWWPLSLFLTATRVVQFWHILRDSHARERGEKTFFGLPHHGIWMVGELTGLAAFPVTWLQMQWIINLDLSKELYILGIAGLIGMLLTPITTQVLRWIERDLKPDEQQHLKELIARATVTQNPELGNV